jgi:hypothetical protein
MGDLMRNSALLAVIVVAACHPAGMRAPVRTAANVAQASSQWRTLGVASAWRGYKAQAVPNGWTFADGVISKTRGVEDIISRDEFGNFELELEWKIGKGGNSGVFYRGSEEYDHVYWSGPEYQLLDDANAPDGKVRLTSAASAYGLYAAPAGVVKPADEWNTTRIIINGAHVEHWLNGQKVVDYQLWSPDWKAKVAASKFKDWPNYGLAKRGHIAIQGDHNGALTIRNARIRELP